MAREPASSAVKGLFVCWTILSSVIAITIPALNRCLLLWVFYDIVDCAGLLCRHLCHVLHTFLNHTHRIDHEKMYEVIKPYKAETEGRLVKITQHLIHPTQNL